MTIERFSRAAVAGVAVLMMAGCQSLMLSPGSVKPVGQPNVFGKRAYEKQSEISVVAETFAGAIKDLAVQRPEAFRLPSCSPELDATAQLLCEQGKNIALAVAYSHGHAVTPGGKIGQAAASAIGASAQKSVEQTRARAGAFGIFGRAYFDYRSQKSLVESFASIATTTAENPNIQIGSIQQSSSRHSGSGGDSESGDGSGTSGQGGPIDGTSLNQLVIGSGNSSNIGTDSARIAGAANRSTAVQAEPSSTVATFQNVYKPQGVTTADEQLNSPAEVNDPDGTVSF